MNLFLDLFGTKVAYASLDSFIGNVEINIVNPLIGFLFAVALVYFLYGGLEFIMNQANEEKKTSGKSHMLWGVIGIVIMMGVWGILNIIIKTFNIQGVEPQKGTVSLPK
jgi:zinc transporter ZupT